MKVLTAFFCASLLGVALAGECAYSRRTGSPNNPPFFLNEFTDSGNVNFAGEDGADIDVLPGNKTTFTFDGQYNIFAFTGNDVYINDDGRVSFNDAPPIQFGVLADVLNYKNPAGTPGTYETSDFNNVFATARWHITDPANEFTFSYQYINRSAIIDASGNTLKSRCTLERLEAILSDCAGSTTDSSVPDYGTILVNEALIVTFKITGASVTEYTQVVIALTNDSRTRIMFLYEGASGFSSLDGLINGEYSTEASNKWQSVCEDSGNVAFESLSNCHCGPWNKGIFVFDTTDTSNDPSIRDKECSGTKANSCGNPNSLPTYLQNRYCSNPVTPDVCREDLTCEWMSFDGSATTFKMVVTFRDNPVFTQGMFIDTTAWGTGTITVKTDPSCNQTIQSNGTLTFTFDTTTAATCGIAATGSTLTSTLLISNVEDVKIASDGYRVLSLTCDFNDLPKSVTVTPEFQTFPTVTRLTPAGRSVDFFINSELVHETGNKISSGSAVYLGQDLFLTVCFEEGTLNIQENAEPYGAYPVNCKASSDPTFATNVVDITDAKGCKLTTTSHFVMEQEFKSTSVAGNTYEWCMTGGKLDAERWYGSQNVYFRCEVRYCVNQVIRDSSVVTKCEDACAGVKDEDANDARRKRRETYDVTDQESMTVETMLKVIRQPEGSVAQVECADMTVAMAMLVSLIVLLFLAVMVAVMMFVKLQSRHRKRV